MDEGPTFGQMIRALRMGFYWLQRHGCFMRLSGNGPFKCELQPCGLISNRVRTEEPHRKFWPSPDDPNPGIDVEQIEPLRNILRIKRPVMFYIDDNGKMI